ncbi:kinase-like domain protein [Rutstroemia sp. NJR-2017a BVV2]|nr:kinase-like domain protein [Rutstroemia sp. NJR-2017a BVV2]
MTPPPARAICTIRLPTHETLYKELSPTHKTELHMQWANAIQQLFFLAQDPPNRTSIRNWDIVLGIDGSAENYFQDQEQAVSSAKLYPPRYQLPDEISQRLSDAERILRMEMFALGSLLYEISAGHALFPHIDEGEAEGRIIQSWITMGIFPDDLWGLTLAPRILGCWCPGFVGEMMGSRKRGMRFFFFFYVSFILCVCVCVCVCVCIIVTNTPLATLSKYIQAHPYRFSLQVVGGLVSVASLVTIPVLGAAGFAAAGPVAGSAAAAWQSSIGLVEAGSAFAWCQSVAMGGAAVGGLIGAGVGGAGLMAAAMALDGGEFDREELKGRFRDAWERDVRGE